MNSVFKDLFDKLHNQKLLIILKILIKDKKSEFASIKEIYMQVKIQAFIFINIFIKQIF